MACMAARSGGSGAGGASWAWVQRLKLLPGGEVSPGNRAGRCPDDHVSCGQVDAQFGQPGDQAGLPGNAGDTTAAQNKARLCP